MSRLPQPRIPREIIKARRKPNPRRQVEHRKFIAALGICLACGSVGECECGHVRNNSDGGMGLKPSDRFSVPLGSLRNCGCHAKQHQRGEITFWSDAGIDPLDASIRLWTISGDIEAGRATILKVRQRAELRRVG